MAITNYYVRPVNGTDVAGQGTTHMTAYKTTQFALDDIGGTHGQGADGDQINICDEGPDVLAATLSLAAYGNPGATRPLLLCGYTALANDGGTGEIDGNGSAVFNTSTTDGLNWRDLKLGNTGADFVIYQKQFGSVALCEIYGGTGGLRFASDGNVVTGCYIHDCPGQQGILSPGPALLVCSCYIVSESAGGAFAINSASAVGNIIVTSEHGISAKSAGIYAQNVIVGAGNDNKSAISLPFSSNAYIVNNIIMNFSGAGNVGINSGRIQSIIAGNAFYNNTTNEALVNGAVVYESPILLAADPFVNAAGGDFSLTDAAKLLLRSAGWPSSYLGASTDPHITIGAVQYGAAEAGGGGVIRRAMRMIGG